MAYIKTYDEKLMPMGVVDSSTIGGNSTPQAQSLNLATLTDGFEAEIPQGAYLYYDDGQGNAFPCRLACMGSDGQGTAFLFLDMLVYHYFNEFIGAAMSIDFNSDYDDYYDDSSGYFVLIAQYLGTSNGKLSIQLGSWERNEEGLNSIAEVVAYLSGCANTAVLNYLNS